MNNHSVEDSTVHFIGPSGAGKSLGVTVFREAGTNCGVRVVSGATGDWFRQLSDHPAAAAMTIGAFPDSLEPIFSPILRFMGSHVTSLNEGKHVLAIIDGGIRHTNQISELSLLWVLAGVPRGVMINPLTAVLGANKLAIKTPIPVASDRILERARRELGMAEKGLKENVPVTEIIAEVLNMLQNGLISKSEEKKFLDLEKRLSRAASSSDNEKIRLEASLKLLGDKSASRRDDVLESVVNRRLSYYARYADKRWEPGSASLAAINMGYGFDYEVGVLIQNLDNRCYVVTNNQETSLGEFKETVGSVAQAVFANLFK